MVELQSTQTKCPSCSEKRVIVGDVKYAMQSCPHCGPNESLLRAIRYELQDARRKFPEPLNSAHEGYAVLKEEVDELWDEVKMKKELRSKERMRSECIQIAAMAIKFIEDLT